MPITEVGIKFYVFLTFFSKVKDLQKEIYTFYNNSFCSKYNINRTSLGKRT